MTGSLGVSRNLILIGLLLFSPVAAAEPEQISLEVATASAAHDFGGRPALIIYLSSESRRAFAAFTKEYVGRFFEVRLLDRAPIRIQIVDPITAGTMQLPGAENDDDSVELSRRLASPGTKIHFRVISK
jgi:hypothetical protein